MINKYGHPEIRLSMLGLECSVVYWKTFREMPIMWITFDGIQQIFCEWNPRVQHWDVLPIKTAVDSVIPFLHMVEGFGRLLYPEEAFNGR